MVSAPHPDALAATLQAMAALPSSDLQDMGANARRLAERELSWDAIGKKVCRVVDKVELAAVSRPADPLPLEARATPRRTLALVDDLVRERLPERIEALRATGAWVEFVDYRRLGEHLERLRAVVREQGIDFVFFARNDQVFDKVSIGPLIRALGVGYSSFSGIDTPGIPRADARMFGRLLVGQRHPGPGPRRSRQRERGAASPGTVPGTFSLIFDLEQLGGARFGLPRILDVLDRHGATATFFTTNFMTEVYRDIADLITRRGHEIGLHGLYHEYLAGRPLGAQSAMIGRMKGGFGPGVPIAGANFIGRMDTATIGAMAENELEYWVQFMEHSYRPFGYRKMPLAPAAGVDAEGDDVGRAHQRRDQQPALVLGQKHARLGVGDRRRRTAATRECPASSVP